MSNLKSLSSVFEEILKGDRKNLGSSPCPASRPLFFWLAFCDVACQTAAACQIWRRCLHLLRKYKGYCFLKICKPQWVTLIFGNTDFAVGFADPVFPIQCTTFVELWLQYSLCLIFRLQWKILNFERLGWALKIVGPECQKAHPYAKAGRINRLSYMAVTVFERYTAPINYETASLRYFAAVIAEKIVRYRGNRFSGD